MSNCFWQIGIFFEHCFWKEEVAADGSHKQILHCEDQRLHQPTDHQITSAPWGMRAGGMIRNSRHNLQIISDQGDHHVTAPGSTHDWSHAHAVPSSGPSHLSAPATKNSGLRVTRGAAPTFQKPRRFKSCCKPTHRTARPFSANYLQSTNAGLL